ncbi:MAG TPA: hypothetical protein VNS58_15985 [Puia sp.]|nr:hypothetical protein [Puia sp.]
MILQLACGTRSEAQDSIGYIWIVTRSGLNRFNGNNFVQFHSGNDSLTLPEENLSGLVWLGVIVVLYPLCRWFDRYKGLIRGWVGYL